MKHNEIWKPVMGYEGLFMVSDCGRIKSMNYNGTGKEMLLNLSIKYDGYYKPTLYKDGKYKTFRLHRLVWEAFNGAIPDGMVVDHINFNRADNRLSNLQLLSRGDNARKRSDGVDEKQREAVQERLGIRVLQINPSTGEIVRTWKTMREAERVLGLANGSVSNAVRHVRGLKTAGGYKWTLAQ